MRDIFLLNCQKKQFFQQGSVLLIAILMSGVVLTVGFGVYARTYKELLFASFWKQTQIAFAAADAGLECAIYWDLHPSVNYSCFGNLSAPWPIIPIGSSQTLTMNVVDGCVSVKISKNATDPQTVIEARGYNDSCGSTNPRRVERGLGAAY